MKRALCVCFVLAACGDPLVGPEFVGTPELSIGGVVMQGNPRIPASHGQLALSVFWISTASTAAVEQEARLDSGLAEYSMTLFDAPPAEASGFSELLPGGALALGVIALYADRDGNGALDLSRDLLLGASAQHVLVFAGAPVLQDTMAAELLGTVEPGYHVYMHNQMSACHFVARSSCPAEGALVPADPRAVSLSLWPMPEEVIVPAPALFGGSIWTAQE